MHTPRAQRTGCTTCCDDAQGKTASLLKILAGDGQGGCVDQPTTQACRETEQKARACVTAGWFASTVPQSWGRITKHLLRSRLPSAVFQRGGVKKSPRFMCGQLSLLLSLALSDMIPGDSYTTPDYIKPSYQTDTHFQTLSIWCWRGWNWDFPNIVNNAATALLEHLFRKGLAQQQNTAGAAARLAESLEVSFYLLSDCVFREA